MNIKVKKRKGCCIFDFERSELTLADVEELGEQIKGCRKSTKVALNFENVERVDESFFDLLKLFKGLGRGFSLLTPKSSLLALFSLRKTFNLAPIYLNLSDFLKNKRQIIKRDFRIV